MHRWLVAHLKPDKWWSELKVDTWDLFSPRSYWFEVELNPSGSFFPNLLEPSVRTPTFLKGSDRERLLIFCYFKTPDENICLLSTDRKPLGYLGRVDTSSGWLWSLAQTGERTRNSLKGGMSVWMNDAAPAYHRLNSRRTILSLLDASDKA